MVQNNDMPLVFTMNIHAFQNKALWLKETENGKESKQEEKELRGEQEEESM